MTDRVKIDQSWSDEFKVKVVANGRLLPITVFVFLLVSSTYGIGLELSKSNDLRQQELEIAKKQYQLDSLRYYSPVAGQQQLKQK